MTNHGAGQQPVQREVTLVAVQRVGNDLVFRDELTGLFNRRLLSELFERWWEETLRQCGRLALIMIDLDGFKDVNDRHGHLVGDRVLRRVAGVLVESFRVNDLVVRYGGDEMVVVLPGAGAEEAAALGDRARDVLRREPLELDGEGGDLARELSFSVGVAAYPEDGTSGQELLEKADLRLYRDKKDRRGVRKGRARRRRRLMRWALGVTVVLVTAAATTLVVLLLTERPGRVTIRAERPPELAVPAPDASSREAELEAQIESLRAEMAALSRQRERAVAGDEERDAASREEQLAALRGRVATLEQMLDEASADDPVAEAGDVPPPVAAVEPSEPRQPPAAAEEVRKEAAVQRPTGVPDEPSSQATPAPPPPVVQAPVLLRVPTPRYPEWARRFRRYATVRLQVVVGPSGEVVQAETLGERVGYGFDVAAREAAMDAVFEPATVDGKPVEAEATLVIRFDLAGSGG